MTLYNTLLASQNPNGAALHTQVHYKGCTSHSTTPYIVHLYTERETVGVRPELRRACANRPRLHTHIFMVPFGPRLLFRTSWSPRAALMFTAKAAWALATSAFGLSAFTAAIVLWEDRIAAPQRKSGRFQMLTEETERELRANRVSRKL